MAAEEGPGAGAEALPRHPHRGAAQGQPGRRETARHARRRVEYARIQPQEAVEQAGLLAVGVAHLHCGRAGVACGQQRREEGGRDHGDLRRFALAHEHPCAGTELAAAQHGARAAGGRARDRPDVVEPRLHEVLEGLLKPPLLAVGVAHHDVHGAGQPGGRGGSDQVLTEHGDVGAGDAAQQHGGAGDKGAAADLQLGAALHRAQLRLDAEHRGRGEVTEALGQSSRAAVGAGHGDRDEGGDVRGGERRDEARAEHGRAGSRQIAKEHLAAVAEAGASDDDGGAAHLGATVGSQPADRRGRPGLVAEGEAPAQQRGLAVGVEPHQIDGADGVGWAHRARRGGVDPGGPASGHAAKEQAPALGQVGSRHPGHRAAVDGSTRGEDPLQDRGLGQMTALRVGEPSDQAGGLPAGVGHDHVGGPHLPGRGHREDRPGVEDEGVEPLVAAHGDPQPVGEACAVQQQGREPTGRALAGGHLVEHGRLGAVAQAALELLEAAVGVDHDDGHGPGGVRGGPEGQTSGAVAVGGQRRDHVHEDGHAGGEIAPSGDHLGAPQRRDARRPQLVDVRPTGAGPVVGEGCVQSRRAAVGVEDCHRHPPLLVRRRRTPGQRGSVHARKLSDQAPPDDRPCSHREAPAGQTQRRAAGEGARRRRHADERRRGELGGGVEVEEAEGQLQDGAALELHLHRRGPGHALRGRAQHDGRPHDVNLHRSPPADAHVTEALEAAPLDRHCGAALHGAPVRADRLEPWEHGDELLLVSVAARQHRGAAVGVVHAHVHGARLGRWRDGHEGLAGDRMQASGGLQAKADDGVRREPGPAEGDGSAAGRRAARRDHGGQVQRRWTIVDVGERVGDARRGVPVELQASADGPRQPRRQLEVRQVVGDHLQRRDALASQVQAQPGCEARTQHPHLATA